MFLLLLDVFIRKSILILLSLAIDHHVLVCDCPYCKSQGLKKALFIFFDHDLFKDPISVDEYGWVSKRKRHPDDARKRVISWRNHLKKHGLVQGMEGFPRFAALPFMSTSRNINTKAPVPHAPDPSTELLRGLENGLENLKRIRLLSLTDRISISTSVNDKLTVVYRTQCFWMSTAGFANPSVLIAISERLEQVLANCALSQERSNQETFVTQVEELERLCKEFMLQSTGSSQPDSTDRTRTSTGALRGQGSVGGSPIRNSVEPEAHEEAKTRPAKKRKLVPEPWLDQFGGISTEDLETVQDYWFGMIGKKNQTVWDYAKGKTHLLNKFENRTLREIPTEEPYPIKHARFYQTCKYRTVKTVDGATFWNEEYLNDVIINAFNRLMNLWQGVDPGTHGVYNFGTDLIPFICKWERLPDKCLLRHVTTWEGAMEYLDHLGKEEVFRHCYRMFDSATSENHQPFNFFEPDSGVHIITATMNVDLIHWAPLAAVWDGTEGIILVLDGFVGTVDEESDTWGDATVFSAFLTWIQRQLSKDGTDAPVIRWKIHGGFTKRVQRDCFSCGMLNAAVLWYLRTMPVKKLHGRISGLVSFLQHHIDRIGKSKTELMSFRLWMFACIMNDDLVGVNVNFDRHKERPRLKRAGPVRVEPERPKRPGNLTPSRITYLKVDE